MDRLNNIDLVIPVIATTSLPNEDQIRHIQSLVTEKLLEFSCLELSRAPLYSVKINITLEKY